MQSKSIPSDHRRTRGAYPRAKPSSDQPRTEPASLVNAPLSAKGQFVHVKGWLCVHARGTTSCVCAASSSPLQTASISLSSCCCSPRCRWLRPPAPLHRCGHVPAHRGKRGSKAKVCWAPLSPHPSPLLAAFCWGDVCHVRYKKKKNNDNKKHDHDRSWYQ